MQQRSGQAQPIDGVGRLLKIRHLKAQSQPKWQGWGIGSSQKILLCPGWTDSGSLVCGFGVVKLRIKQTGAGSLLQRQQQP